MKKVIAVSSISLAIIFSSCFRNEAELLRVASPLPSGIVPNTSVLTLKFSKAVARGDSTTQWSATPYVEFTPTIPGRFIWSDSATLVFSPDAPFPGDTKFKAKLNTSLLTAMAGMKAFDGDDAFAFSTESFTLRSAEFFYDRLGEQRQVGIKVNLEFTYAVDPRDVANTIRITIDGEPKQFARMATTEKSKVIAMDIGTVKELQKERVIAIDFDKSLLSSETGTAIKLEKPFVYKMPGLEELKIYGHEFGFDGTTGWIRIRTSQEVMSQAVKKHLSIEPSRDYVVEHEPDGFVVRGKFEPGTPFHLVIKKGLESELGGKTQHEYEADVVIGNVEPSFRFGSSRGSYMLLSGQRTLELKTVNLSSLTIRISQVFQNNIVFFLDHGRYYDYDYYYENEGSVREPKYRYTLGNYGRVLSDDSITISGRTNEETISFLDLNPYLKNGFKGFYLVEIANPSEAWRSTSKLIAISDIGLIVKQSGNEMLAFAASLETNEPLANVQVSVISTNNQTMASAKTDQDGVARFEGLRETARDFVPKLITAELESDFNFINLADYAVETSRFDVGGKRDANQLYDAFMYGDRTIYRPGEKIVVSAIVRNLTEKLPAQMPVRLKLYSPRGTLLSETQHTLNEEGSFESSYQTSAAMQTGDCRFELYTGNNLFLTSYVVSVEDFVPDRLRVNLKASAEKAKPSEQLTYDVQAFNFFGPPAAGRNYEFEGTFTPVPFSSERFREFRFSDDAATNYSGSPEVFTGKTDQQGRARIEFSIPQNLTSTGLLRAQARVGVFDESGRPVYQYAQTLVYPKSYYIGIRNSGRYYVSPNTPQKMELIAVDMNDKPIKNFKAKIELVRNEWHSVLRQHEQTKTLRYVSERREIPVRTERVTVSDKPLEYTYIVPRSGDYTLRVSKDGESGYNQFSFYSYSWATSDVTSFEIDPEARVDMVCDKKVYAPGDKAKILFQAPFNGKMLVTLERNRVFSYRYLDVKDNAASLEVPVDEKFLPNVYVSAVLFRKIKEQNIPLMAGHGFAPMMVEKKANRLEVAVVAPQKIRPKTKQSVSVKTNEANVFVTLAAVDEGICQVKNYKTPDPYDHFYQKKALETQTFDFFRDLIPEPVRSKGRSSTGGGDAELMAKRVNPIGVQRFTPLAIWSGIIKTNGSGAAEVTLDVPQFSGELRLMALAYKGDRFGSAQQPMKVADPIIITPALPRFLSPNDSLSMALTAFNTTARSTTLTFDIQTAGEVVPITKSAALEMGPNQEKFVGVALKSSSNVGKAVVTVRTSAFGETFETTTELPVRPISPFTSDAIAGYVDGGKTAQVFVKDDYLSFHRKAYITLSPYPVANFAKELKYLVGYPHGCLEQTVSKAFPQIYLRDIATMLDPTILNTGSPMYFVNEAITKVATMQEQNGAFTYWPGEQYYNNWTTVYATHFLYEAKKAGYAVPEATLKSAMSAVAAIARSKQTRDYYYYINQGQKTVVKRIADKSSLYALYVLALAGRPEKAVMDFYRNEKSLLTNDTRVLLAGAYAHANERKAFLDLLPAEFGAEQSVRESGGDFDSPTRANALILNVLLDTDLNNPNIPRYMEYLSKNYRSPYWFSTQDNAFTLLAFGKAARMASATKVEGTISVGGKELSYKGGNQKFDIAPFGKPLTVSMAGNGRVYYSIVTEGIRKDGAVRIEDKGLRIRREYFDRSGTQINLSSVRQNDLLIVRLTLSSSVDRLENIAISDLLPAGFEIENPRLTATANYPFVRNSATPEYMDVRDDRMNLYTSIIGGTREKEFYYMVRAVTPGVFQHAPVVAEAMYNADYYSASGQGVVRIGR